MSTVKTCLQKQRVVRRCTIAVSMCIEACALSTYCTIDIYSVYPPERYLRICNMSVSSNPPLSKLAIDAIILFSKHSLVFRRSFNSHVLFFIAIYI
jgi:hypothetical protein